jgi:tRNA-2-methylthio-N6-dimethylallyladenosine synthase
MRFFIENFGCQMNEQDKAKMTRLLQVEGHEEAGDLTSADLVIVNTCCVREKAEQKFYSLMGRLERIKKRRGIMLGVTGCVAQLEGQGMAERLPFIDFSLGPSAIHRINEAVGEGTRGTPFFDFSDNGCSGVSLSIAPGNVAGGIKAYVTIMKGCDNYCSYCVVPYVRGREASRQSREIIDEVRGLVRQGVKEVTLLGQNVNSYNKGASDLTFPQLLKEINGTEGIERIRFVTSHPKDLSPELIDCFGTLGKLCEQIHLPFQSGSNKILNLMNRGYSIGEYKEKVARLRERCPAIAITADCIVGFPQEDEEDFMRTLALIEQTAFDGVFSFAYSSRPRTTAATFAGAVPREEALARLRHLQSIQKAITFRKNRQMEGERAEVLVEGPSKNSPEDLSGRTRTNKVVNFRGAADLAGRIVEVHIVNGYANSLRGEFTAQKGL